MGNVGNLVDAFLLSFGSLALGVALLFVRAVAKHSVSLLWKVLAVNVGLYGVSFLFVFYCKSLGYTEWFYATFSYFLVNFVFALIYIVMLLVWFLSRKPA